MTNKNTEKEGTMTTRSSSETPNIIDLNAQQADALLVCQAVVHSATEPQPLWLRVQGSPATGKTTIARYLERIVGSDKLHEVDALSPPRLISGRMRSKKMPDPSLLARLNGLTLILKDWPECLISPKEVQGILRDAYDGKVRQQFLNGETREYKCHFGMITFSTTRSKDEDLLGGRFLCFNLDSVELMDPEQLDVFHDRMKVQFFTLQSYLTKLSDHETAFRLTRKVAYDTSVILKLI